MLGEGKKKIGEFIFPAIKRNHFLCPEINWKRAYKNTILFIKCNEYNNDQYSMYQISICVVVISIFFKH